MLTKYGDMATLLEYQPYEDFLPNIADAER
jgi:hypothetical protein